MEEILLLIMTAAIFLFGGYITDRFGRFVDRYYNKPADDDAEMRKEKTKRQWQSGKRCGKIKKRRSRREEEKR